jgi:hypothetical protein
MAYNKSIVGKFLLGILCLNSVAEIRQKTEIQAAYQKYMNPGMAIRLEQDTIDGMKLAMAKFMPQYTHLDAHLPTELAYDFNWGLGLLDWNFVWTDVTYSKPQLDIKDIKLLLVDKYDDRFGP